MIKRLCLLVLVLLCFASTHAAMAGTYFSPKNWGTQLSAMCPTREGLNKSITLLNRFAAKNAQSEKLNLEWVDKATQHKVKQRNYNYNMSGEQIMAVLAACGLTTVAQMHNMMQRLTSYQTCKRQQYKVDKATAANCSAFCKKKAKEIGCSLSGPVAVGSQYCVCNDFPYREVCGKDKGKTGAKEYCVTDAFRSTNVGQIEARTLAKEYARVKHGKKVRCSSNYRKSSNDEYLCCTATDGSAYYEFRFDDVTESVDSYKFDTGVRAICEGIYGSVMQYGACKGVPCTKMAATLNAFGYTGAPSNGSDSNSCRISQRVISGKQADDKLAKIEGLDNYVFFHGIQFQASNALIDNLRNYVRWMGHDVSNFRCDGGFGVIENSLIAGNDDVLRCYVGNRPIDFVFDDASEAWLYTREAGAAAIDCIVMGGKYQGKYCHGVSKENCLKLDVVAKRKGAEGTKWENDMCVLRDAADAKKYDLAMNFGVGLVGAADCLVLTHSGCWVAMATITAITVEAAANDAISESAMAFLRESTQCNDAECAKRVLMILAGRVLNIRNDMTDEDLHAVDTEFARLVDLVPPQEFAADVTPDDWNDIVTQLGGDPDNKGGRAFVIGRKIAVVAQLASIGTWSLPAAGKAIARLGTRGKGVESVAGTLPKAMNGVAKGRQVTANVINKAGHVNDAANAPGTISNKLYEESAPVPVPVNGRS